MNHTEVLMEAIWLNRKLLLPNGERHIRITEGMSVQIENNELVDAKSGIATHKIIGCYGTIDSSILFINVMDLQTLELSTLKLKGE